MPKVGPDPDPMPDFTAWLEAQHFNLVFQNYAAIVYEKGHLRVSLANDLGTLYVTIDNARPDEYLADAYDADVWRAHLEGGKRALRRYQKLR